MHGAFQEGVSLGSLFSLWTLVLNWELLKTESAEIGTVKSLHLNPVFYSSEGLQLSCHLLAYYSNESGTLISQHTAEEKKWPGKVVVVVVSF